MGDTTYLAVAYIVMIGLIAAWSWTLARRLQHFGTRLDVAERNMGISEDE